MKISSKKKIIGKSNILLKELIENKKLKYLKKLILLISVQKVRKNF